MDSTSILGMWLVEIDQSHASDRGQTNRLPGCENFTQMVYTTNNDNDTILICGIELWFFFFNTASISTKNHYFEFH